MSYSPTEWIMSSKKEETKSLGLNANGINSQYTSTEDLKIEDERPALLDRGTQTGKSQVDKGDSNIVTHASEENDHLFTNSLSIQNTSPLNHIAQSKEMVPTPSTVPFRIFLPKDHLLIKQVKRVEQSDQIEIDVRQASSISKRRGKKSGKKRNQRIIKNKEQKVKFEVREQLEYADTMKLGLPLKNSLNKTEGAFVVGQAQVLAQTDDPVTPVISRVRPDSSIMFPTELAHNVDKGPQPGASFQSMGGKFRGDMAPDGQTDLPDYLEFLAIFDSNVCINRSFILSCFLEINGLILIESSDIVRVFPDHCKGRSQAKVWFYSITTVKLILANSAQLQCRGIDVIPVREKSLFLGGPSNTQGSDPINLAINGGEQSFSTLGESVQISLHQGIRIVNVVEGPKSQGYGAIQENCNWLAGVLNRPKPREKLNPPCF
ncbi:hypothetical protein NDU88_005856 [Pleurodeles waltl]|uniref:Uncharacterized protein n=1 Tax=Pleurodeles waltl TaxID=8319 RepID=A0AAV7MXI1_PLEWA|nr:hypothetical protein NDU88_005856 [Pleurodeles waltl]